MGLPIILIASADYGFCYHIARPWFWDWGVGGLDSGMKTSASFILGCLAFGLGKDARW